MKKIGILAHSAEGASLCFLTACHNGSERLGTHMHPTVVMSALPMGLSMDGWNHGRYEEVAPHLIEGARLIKNAEADFFVCPDNTAHLVLESIIDQLPLPGLHIAHVVCHQIAQLGISRVALLGTKWTMTGSVYENALSQHGMVKLVPNEDVREKINDAIFDELCQGRFTKETTSLFIRTIEDLKSQGAQCVILGCTEIPLIVTPDNSPLPTLDSTRLLARYAVDEAIKERSPGARGWIELD